MYCPHCGTPATQSLSFCNRCGASLREKGEIKITGAISALLTAITLVALGGLGIMLGGALVLRNGASLGQELIGFFMLFTFLIIAMTEFMLVRNVSKLIGSLENQPKFTPVQQPPLELRPPSVSSMGEPVGSVTENTTRTLGYARREL
jgi:hypothetical protein